MSPLVYQYLADGVVVVHLAFILFVLLGGLTIPAWPRMAWVHLPCVLWGAMVESAGWICPLTPLENFLRSRAGQGSYGGDFVLHLIEPVIYPPWLTREIQLFLGSLVVLVNLCVYGLVILRIWHRSRTGAPKP
ncbi:MAG TPA: DUF2784 domain-containing protein [Deltaproteobacteria bacterium]|nr:DUF2784 domain-containing protein [Deltaproteobacteria bacterium]HQI82450.1 DUF2784 domain-containing protein [Deltaproteobacteria bacterium]